MSIKQVQKNEDERGREITAITRSRCAVIIEFLYYAFPNLVVIAARTVFFSLYD